MKNDQRFVFKVLIFMFFGGFSFHLKGTKYSGIKISVLQFKNFKRLCEHDFTAYIM